MEKQTNEPITEPSKTIISESKLLNIIQKAEETRTAFMRSYRGRQNALTTITLLLVIAGGSAFAWFFFMQNSPLYAFGALATSLALPLLIQPWTKKPLFAYRRYYKTNFLPNLAKTLGRMKYAPKRGISTKILKHTGITPSHDHYSAEDCFSGRYKGIKFILSEATLTKGREQIFRGVLAFIESPQGLTEGLSIITADRELAANAAKKLQALELHHPDYALPFQAYTSDENNINLLKDHALLKELYEIYELFEKTSCSFSFFRKKYIFMMIPSTLDMFEPSHISVPISIHGNIKQCQCEVERILSIIDVLDIYARKEA